MLINRQQIYIDFSNFDSTQSHISQDVVDDALNKVQQTFSEVQVDFTLERPKFGDYSTIEVTNTSTEPGNYWGRAEQSSLDPNDNGQIRLDNIESQIEHLDISLDQVSNAIANSISHEAGHLMGLDHTQDFTRVMGNQVNPNMINHQLTFSPSEVNVMNSEVNNMHTSPGEANSMYGENCNLNEDDIYLDHEIEPTGFDSEETYDTDGFDFGLG